MVINLVMSICTGAACHSGVNQNADLQRKIYAEARNAPACVRLLNATGAVGCAAEPVAAPLLLMSNAAVDPVPGRNLQASLADKLLHHSKLWHRNTCGQCTFTLGVLSD